MELTRKKVLAIGLTLVAVVVAVVIVFITTANSPKEVASPTDNPSSTTQSSPIAVPTEQVQEPSTDAPAPVPTQAPVKPAPSPSAKPVGEEFPPAVSPDMIDIALDGQGYDPAMEASLSKEEIQARDTIQQALPIYMNANAPIYKSPRDAAKELTDKNLITAKMAQEDFLPEFTNFGKAINAAKYTVQTTGMHCYMRGQTPETAIERGSVTCYFTRLYLAADGSKISARQFEKDIQGAGEIDAEQIARVAVGVKNEGGIWKVDSILFNR